MLKLNDDKTEFIVFISKHNVKTFVEQSIKVGSTEVDISLKVSNHGIIFHQTLSMESQVYAVAKMCFYYLRNIAIIVFAVLWLDYCNVIFINGQHKKTLQILYRV